MRRFASNAPFIVMACTCNLLVGVMFAVLNVPHVDVQAIGSVHIVPPKHLHFVATTGTPVRIAIPDLSMDIPVRIGTFDPLSEEWTLSEDSAYYAAFSVPTNDSNGTTLIYGHAKPNMFEPLTGLQPGMRISVYTDNAKVFTYEFSAVSQVIPTDTSVLTDAGPPTLVLQTCTGPWDAYRALYRFDYKTVVST